MGLLSLPLELRRLIIHNAICTPSDPPTPTCPSNSQDGRLIHSTAPIRSGLEGVWQLPLQNPALSLLLVNRQLHDEIKDVLPFVPPRYHVDIMFVKTYGLWTTWSIPVRPRTQYIDAVSYAFRIFEPTDDLDKRFAASLDMRRGKYNSPPDAVWAFYNMLELLFDFGPGFSFKQSPRYIVGTISIDMLAPTDGAPHTNVLKPEKDIEPDDQRLGVDGTRQDGESPEEALADWIHRQLCLIRDISGSCYLGVCLYECVRDRIVFLVNGKEHKSFNMDELFEEQQRSKWGVASRNQDDETIQWKARVVERRKKMKEGLEVYP